MGQSLKAKSTEDLAVEKASLIDSIDTELFFAEGNRLDINENIPLSEMLTVSLTVLCSTGEADSKRGCKMLCCEELTVSMYPLDIKALMSQEGIPCEVCP